MNCATSFGQESLRKKRARIEAKLETVAEISRRHCEERAALEQRQIAEMAKAKADAQAVVRSEGSAECRGCGAAAQLPVPCDECCHALCERCVFTCPCGADYCDACADVIGRCASCDEAGEGFVCGMCCELMPCEVFECKSHVATHYEECAECAFTAPKPG